jgi:hypothetical protein
MRAEAAALKRKYFGSSEVPLHRSEIESSAPKGHFAPLRDPHTRAAFYAELLALLNSWDYTAVTIFMDKLHYKRRNPEGADPYCYALNILLDRYVWFLEGVNGQGDIVYEKRDSPKVSPDDRDSPDHRLEQAFADLLRTGTRYRKPAELRSRLLGSRLIPRTKKMNVMGLQIADLLAYPSYLEIIGKDKSGNYPISLQPKDLSLGIINILPFKYWRKRGQANGHGRIIIQNNAYK